MPQSSITVRDLMSTALITAHPDDKVRSADIDMRLADIRHVPIIDDRNHVIGIVSNRDILRALARPGNETLTMGQIMTPRVRTIPATAPAYEAVELMVKHKIGCVPVESETGELIGLVTETDFLHLAHEHLIGQLRDEEEAWRS